MHAWMMALGLMGFSPPPDSLPPVTGSGIRWKTYQRLWTTWMQHRGLPSGTLSPMISTPPHRPPSTDPSLDYRTIPETLRLTVAQFHDFFRFFLAGADLLFIGEKVDFEVPPDRRQIYALRTCPRVRYTYRIREILFSTGRIPVRVGNTLDFYGLDAWTGHYEAFLNSRKRTSHVILDGHTVPPPPVEPIQVSVYWIDPFYPRTGDEAMFLSPHPVSPALIAVRLWTTLRESCEKDRLTVSIRPPWTLDRLPGLLPTFPLLLAFQVEEGDTTFFFPLWRGWVWDRLTMQDVRWIARKFQEAFLREKGDRP